MASLRVSVRPQHAPFVCQTCLARKWAWRRESPSPLRLLSSMSATTRTSSYLSRPVLPQFRNDHRLSNALKPSQRTRHFSLGVNAIPSEPSVVPLRHRCLLAITGPDAAKFLQGLVTNDVSSDHEVPFYTAFLDARGRVLWDVFIYPWRARDGSWGCYIEVDSIELDALRAHLKKHKLRSRIELRQEDGLHVWASWGLATDLQGPEIMASLADPRAPGFGIRYVVKRESILFDESFVKNVHEYHVRRYLYGIPEGQKEIPRESALPMEYNIDLSQGIDFKKGCYVGQELTIRTKHTGVVRKRILPIQLYRSDTSTNTVHSTSGSYDSVPKEGANIKQLDEDGTIKKGRASGKFIASIGNVGLALCRLEMMTPMQISAERVSWKSGMKFGVETQAGEMNVLRVKAIVPQWFMERERDLWDKNRTRV